MEFTSPTSARTLRQKYVIISVIAVLLLGGGFFFFKGSGEDLPETITVVSSDFLQEVSVSGKVVASETVDIAFNQIGRVSGIFAVVGDVVSTGSVLVSIENGDVRVEVLQKEAALESAQADLDALRRGARPEEVSVSKAKIAQNIIKIDDGKILSIINT